MKKGKATLALALAAVMAAGTPGVMPVMADAVPSVVSDRTAASQASADSLTSEESMKKVLAAAKKKLTIPEKCDKFEYSFYQNGGNSVQWRFMWYSEDGQDSYEAVCDENAHIISVSTYKNENGYRSSAPKYLSGELQEKAEKYITQLEPLSKGYIQYKDCTYSLYGGYYTYIYERVENKIAMPDNTINVKVDASTGALRGFNAVWLYDGKIPAADQLIGEKKAKEIIGKNVSLELRYFTRGESGSEDGTVKTFLAYVPEDGYIAVDAKTGKVYTEKSSWVTDENNTAAFDKKESARLDGGAGGEQLTDEELKAAAELADLISSSDAEAIIKDNKSLLSYSSAKAVSTRLITYTDNGRKHFVWRIRMEDPRPADYENGDVFRPCINAAVDAETGEILSYDADVKTYYETEDGNAAAEKYSDYKCREIFEDFLLKQNVKRFSQTIRDGSKRDYILKYSEDTPVYGGYAYNYVRVNESVRYDENGIYGAVDSVTGKIYSYGFNWHEDVEFDSPKKAISADTAFDKYISFDGFDLVYEINTINTLSDGKTSAGSKNNKGYSVDTQVRLVYRTEIYPAFVDAFTGKQLDSRGDKYVKAGDYEYSDIKGIKQERSILLLADMGVGFDSGKFYPDRVITKGEFGELLKKAVGFRAEELKLTGGRELSRQFAARSAVEVLGYGTVAEKTDIFTTGYKDEGSIADGYKGYVAIAKAFDIFDITGGSFGPETGVTRAEAADIILRLVNVIE